MSLSGIEWSDLAVFSRYANEFRLKKNLTSEEECVILWLNEQVKALEKKKKRIRIYFIYMKTQFKMPNGILINTLSRWQQSIVNCFLLHIGY